MADKYGNWLGILKWSLAQNDGTHESSMKPMSEEVRGTGLLATASAGAVLVGFT